MDRAVIDHRGPACAALASRVLEGLKTIFKCAGPVLIYPTSGTGAWEAALVNTLSPGDRLLMCNAGQFAQQWAQMAKRFDLQPEPLQSDWRTGVAPAAVEARLVEDHEHQIKAVCVLHNETSTGCLSPIAAIRRAIDAANHPALFMVDTISSLASTEYRHDAWGVDVGIGAAQKGLMLPPGIAFNALSEKALKTAAGARLPKSFFAWEDMLTANRTGFFPYTPATNMLHGLLEAISMLHEEGLEHVFARHDRLAAATRRAVTGWGLELVCRDPGYYSPTVTAVLLPAGHNADQFRARALAEFNVSLGTGFGPFAGKAFRIGHLGDTDPLTIIAALAGVEMTLDLTAAPHRRGGVQAAMAHLVAATEQPARHRH